MELETWKDIFDILHKIITVSAIILGGIWTIYKFGLFREKFPSLEISNGMSFISDNPEDYLIELRCKICNKGNVRKWLAPLEFDLLYLEKKDKFIANSDYLNGEVEFKRHLENHTYWVSPTWHIPFIDGKSEKEFKYLIQVSGFVTLWLS